MSQYSVEQPSVHESLRHTEGAYRTESLMTVRTIVFALLRRSSMSNVPLSLYSETEREIYKLEIY